MLKLHGDPRSAMTRKARWALEELARPYELVPVALARGEHKAATMLELNPNGKVPVLEDDGFVLWESDAILWYVAEGSALLPASPRDRALVQQWMSWSSIHLRRVTVDARTMRAVALKLGTPLDTKAHAALLAEAPPLLSILDRQLDRRAFVLGDDFTIADIGLGVNVFFGCEEGLSLDSAPNVRAWSERLASRPAWARIQP